MNFILATSKHYPTFNNDLKDTYFFSFQNWRVSWQTYNGEYLCILGCKGFLVHKGIMYIRNDGIGLNVRFGQCNVLTCYKSNAALSFNFSIESIFYMLAVCYILVSNKIMTERNDMRPKPDFNFRCLKKKIKLSGITVTFETNYILDHFKTIQWKTKLADMFNEIYRNLWFLEEYLILFEMVWEPLYEGIHIYKRYNTCIINT